ncbi:hypothetical protein XA68_16999 [Ophiocordyceps unilateralis]|uniref:Putative transcription factor kapC n=1 Tax=Ophiocordyceps unilateralis TaxID=268505 RepID=A0A2A9PL79_OPHUN|nr:hypothetical protein XA68_16999 [Ophiocordyceps unilateralis]
MQQTTGAGNQEQHLRAQLELLQHHEVAASTPGSTDSRAAPSHSPPSSRPANGFDDLAAASRDAARAVQIKSEAEAHIHPDLRGPPAAPAPNMMPMAAAAAVAAAAGAHSPAPASTPSPSTAIAPAPALVPQTPEQALAADGRKAKRELSQSKRAAQNRAAQRAFRQRKEGYIKKLEQQVREYNDMEQTFKAMQSENYALREYVIHLQSRLIDLQGEFPQPPPNINLSQPTAAPLPPSAGGPDQPPANPGVGTPLEAVAQAVAGLAAQEQMTDSQPPYPSRAEEDTRTADEINRQLQSEEGAARSS